MPLMMKKLNKSPDWIDESFSKYRPDIDGLRAIAVGLVIGYHAFPKLFPGGFIGVDVFFVISGFLITGIISRHIIEGSFSISEFYGRRIRRIFPALILVIAATVAMGWYMLPVNEFKVLGKSVIGSSMFVQNLVMLKEVGYFDVASARKPLLHIWSLGIEEQYYIIWPIILILAARVRANLATLTITLIFASFFFGSSILKKNPEAAFYLPQSRGWELLIGSLLALNATYNWKSKNQSKFIELIEEGLYHLLFKSEKSRQQLLPDTCGILGLGLLAYGLLHFTAETKYPGFHALIPTLGASLLILAKESSVNRTILSSRIFVFMGLISYPIYLWHYPVFAYLRLYLPSGVHWYIMLTAISGVVLVSWLTYSLIESPIRRGNLKVFINTSLVFLMICTFSVGVVLYKTEGFPQRVPAELRPFMLTGDETSVFWRRGTCLLLPDQGAANFGSECAGNGGRPLILYWGDSYAAAEYSGADALRNELKFDVAQYTSSACPPLIGYTLHERPFCKENNDFVMQQIAKIRPDVVILHSTWYNPQSDIEIGVNETVKQLKALHIPKVIFLGPPPSWTGIGLSANVADYYFEHGYEIIPARTRYRLVQNDVDERMRMVAEKNGIQYISIQKMLCNSDGCLSRIGPDGMYLTAYDPGHVTRPAATYVAEQFLPGILKGINKD